MRSNWGKKPKDAVLRQINGTKTFFNKNWDKSLIEEAVLYGHRQEVLSIPFVVVCLTLAIRN